MSVVALGTPFPPAPSTAERRDALANPVLDDRYGRVARDLRVSLTDRCNLRCTYCMPEEGLDWMAQDTVLSNDEVIRLIRIAVEELGIRHVRFTGGEPLLRRGLEDIIAATHQLTTDLGQPVRTALTTNGLGLEKRAASLARAGLDRVNVSLDTIDRQRYATLTRRDRLDDVLAGIEAAVAAGLNPVKINAVVMPNTNEEDIVPLAEYCLEHGLELRFIEQMPLGPRGQWRRDNMVTAEQILERLGERFHLSPVVEPRGSAPAELWTAVARDGGREQDTARGQDSARLQGTIGVIASVTHSFCGACDRTRLTADGAVRTCLFARTETSLRQAMRQGASDLELADMWRVAMWSKLPGHGIDRPDFLQPQRLMSAIGG
ncbi:GTP 3',8-cyclase MoaA [Corynebacterium sp. zg254]|uniref:GTP 3',8-cyclase n=1 Tax=Corynebacterium zhongnanshanii TaxID=2768834 RepID=A0ABQ6VFD8_9CORY|nr:MULTISPECIES: GTP 3',8-cyclase MoaA [Corynebacterium]KAB3523124.1 GTP 3',8-cyclase MoaA [Corynebacterium zhongnanshanii]MCR5913772.1 GTP 3',8-cyclase MoaA [Corynebacterium sp. zg254]